MQQLRCWTLYMAAGLVNLITMGIPSAQTIDFELPVYIAEKTIAGVDQWVLGDAALGAPENFRIQALAGEKWLHAFTSTSTTLHRPLSTANGILDVRWKWRAMSDSVHFCLGVSGAGGSPRLANRALACLEPSGRLTAQGLGLLATASGEPWKKGEWQYMRMVMDNSAGVNKFVLYISGDSLRGVERLAVPALTMAGGGAFTRVVLRNEGGYGFTDVDDISWETTAVWLGNDEAPNDSIWASGHNWSTGAVPDSNTHVLFTEKSPGCALDRNGSAKSITVSPAFAGTLNVGQYGLTIGGKADFSGGNYLYAGIGHIRLPSPHGHSLIPPSGGKILPSLIHDGTGVLRLDGRALFTVNLSQTNGSFDFNGFDLIATGNFSVRNGHPGTLRNLDGRSISVGRSARFEGTSKDILLGLGSSPKGWTLGASPSPTDSVIARFATLANARATSAQGFAYQSIDAGGTSGWVFMSPPAIAVQPKDASVMVGENPFFKVSASGKLTMTYQWLRNDKAIPGAVDSIYFLADARKADSGAAFSCKIANAIGSVASAAAKLSVSFPPPTVNPDPLPIVDSLIVRLITSVTGAKVFYSRNGQPFSEYASGLVLKDSTTLRAYAVLGPDTSGRTHWVFDKQALPQLPEVVIDPEGTSFIDSLLVTMTPPVLGAAMYFSLGDTDPDSADLPYLAPFWIKTTTTVSAIAYKAGFRPSPVHTHIYIHGEKETLPPPMAKPGGGTFIDSIVIKLYPPAEAPEATVYYLLDALGPFKFTDSLILRETATLKAIAISGSRYSDTAFWKFNRRQEAPYATPKGRSFSDTLLITLGTRTQTAATLYYTTDGNDPTSSSRVYPGHPILLDSSAVIKAIAIKGSDTSAILSETYTLIPDTPFASHRGGDYSSLISITLSSSAAGAEIYYTLDGSTPGPERGLPPYKDPFSLDTSATLKAVAVAGQGAKLQRSPMRIENYTFISPGKRVLGPGQRIEFSNNYSLISTLPGASPVDVEVVAVDSMKNLKGFRDILFGIRLSLPQGSAAFPKVVLNAPGGEPRSLYAMLPSGLGKYMTGKDTSEISAPGTYFLAVDTLAPIITYSAESFTDEDSTRLVITIQDNVSNLLLDLERSDSKIAGFTGREITATLVLAVSLKNPEGSILPLTIRLSADDHSRKTVFPAGGSRYALAQRFTKAVRTPAAFHIGTSAAEPWDLVSIPLATTPPLTLAQLRKNNAVTDLEGATYDAAAGNYRFITLNEPLLPGASIWLASSASLPSLEFPGIQTNNRGGAGAYKLTLRPGWNQVANPTMDTLYWPVTRAFPDVYDLSQAKGLHGWNAGTGEYAHAEILEPWRGFIAYYKGTRDTMVTLLNRPVTFPAPVKAGKSAAGNAAFRPASGFMFRLNLAGGISIRLGASSSAADGIGMEDESQPPARSENAPRLYSARRNHRLETDMMRWT
nr:chitobiase/beta-hexosaminidase C-terminal domain-containing protein [Fibrobacterota bacterium]